MVYSLRLSPLESMVVSYFVDGRKSISHRRRQLDVENEIRLSLQKGVSRSRMRNPAEIRCPEDSLIQWLRSNKTEGIRLG